MRLDRGIADRLCHSHFKQSGDRLKSRGGVRLPADSGSRERQRTLVTVSPMVVALGVAIWMFVSKSIAAQDRLSQPNVVRICPELRLPQPRVTEHRVSTFNGTNRSLYGVKPISHHFCEGVFTDPIQLLVDITDLTKNFVEFCDQFIVLLDESLKKLFNPRVCHRSVSRTTR